MTTITTHYSYEEALAASTRIVNSIPPEAYEAMRQASQTHQRITESLAPAQEQLSQIQKLIDTVVTKTTEDPDSIIEALTTNTFGDKEDEFNRQVIDPVINSLPDSTQETDDYDNTSKASINIPDRFPIKPGFKEALNNPPNTTAIDNQDTKKSFKKVSQLFNNLSSFTIKASEKIAAAETVYQFLKWLIAHLN